MGIGKCIIKDEFKSRIFNGRKLQASFFEITPGEGDSAVFDNTGSFLSFIKRKDNDFSYHFVIPEGRL